MKKVIVLGSSGQLGLTINDLAPKETLDFSFFSRKELDIRDKSKLSIIFKNSDFDYCINCAAYTNVESAETNKDDVFLINAKGPKHIAEVCATHNVKLIHISTDYVFDGNNRKPYTTTDRTNPINEYGKSKLQGELYIQDLLVEHYIIRTSWLYSLHGKNFLKTIIRKINENETLKITTEEEGTPTSCLDLAAFIIHIIEIDNIPYGIYNFSALGSTTWFGFAQEIVRYLNYDNSDKILPTDKFITKANRPKYSVLDVTKTEEIYRALNRWEKSVGIMVKKFKS